MEETKQVAKAESRYASRKFTFAVAMWVASTVFFAVKMIDPLQYLEFSKWILALYLVGNVGSSVVELVRK